MRDTVLLRPVNCTFFMQLSIIEDETLILVATVNITSKPIATIFFLYMYECMSIDTEIMKRKKDTR